MTTYNLISCVKFCYNTSLTFLNEALDLSYKMDLDFWNCFGRKKTLSYNRRNKVVKNLSPLVHIKSGVLIFFSGKNVRSCWCGVL